MTSEVPTTLLDLRKLMYGRAGRKWVWSIGLSLMALAATIFGFWTRDASLIVWIGVALAALPIVVTWIRESASDDFLKGDKCRRLLLLSDGLGQAVPPSQVAEVRSWALGASVPPAAFVPPYYSSGLLPGPRRLADNLTESAFFTKALAEKCSIALWITAGIALLGAALALLTADLWPTGTQAAAPSIAKTIGVFIAFVISGDFALHAKRFGDLASEARYVFEASARLRGLADAAAEDVRAVCDDYGVALLQCPPVPEWLYRRHRDELNRLYRESHS